MRLKMMMLRSGEWTKQEVLDGIRMIIPKAKYQEKWNRRRRDKALL